MFNNKGVAKFYKVSFEQFLKDWVDTFDLDINKEETVVETRKVWDSIQLPKRATKGSAGHDISIPFDAFVEPNETLKIPTGIKCKMDENYVMLIFPRSSLGIKKNMYITNTIPVIDSDYFEADNEGHIFLCIKNGGDKVLELKQGDNIVQAVFLPYGTTDDNEILSKRTGGIGSTTK